MLRVEFSSWEREDPKNAAVTQSSLLPEQPAPRAAMRHSSEARDFSHTVGGEKRRAEANPDPSCHLGSDR